MENVDPELAKIAQMVAGPERRLVMNSVPVAAKRAFIKFANENFEGNYGFALEYLMDFLQSLPDQGVELQNWKVSVEGRLAALESKPDEKKQIKLLNRSVIMR